MMRTTTAVLRSATTRTGRGSSTMTPAKEVRFHSTHLDKKTGLPTMVSILAKQSTQRVAIARSSVLCPPCMASVFKARSTGARKGRGHLGEIVTEKKGSVLATAIVAGTMGAKLTSQLIPFCHPVSLEKCTFSFSLHTLPKLWRRIDISCEACTIHKTGVEMEAMVGASVAALTCYDMLKSIVNAQASGLRIGETRLIRKTGGKSDILWKGERRGQQERSKQQTRC